MADGADPMHTRWTRPEVLVPSAYVAAVVLAYLGGQFWWYGDGDGLSFFWLFLLLLPGILVPAFVESILEETAFEAALPWVFVPLLLASAALNTWFLYRLTRWMSSGLPEPRLPERFALPATPPRRRKWGVRVRGNSLEIVRRSGDEE